MMEAPASNIEDVRSELPSRAGTGLELPSSSAPEAAWASQISYYADYMTIIEFDDKTAKPVRDAS